MLTAGSLRIETFEGSRPRLRRTRQGYGCSIGTEAVGVDARRDGRASASEDGCDSGGTDKGDWRMMLPEAAFRVALGDRASTSGHTFCACRSKRCGSWMNGGYEVSAKLSRPADLRADLLSSELFDERPSCRHNAGKANRWRLLAAELRRHRRRGWWCRHPVVAGRVAEVLARRRLARKPQKRMRTKPRGRVWSRNRRRNSSAVTVISRCLLLCA